MIRYAKSADLTEPHTYVCDGCKVETKGRKGKRRLDKPEGWITVIFVGDDSNGKTTYSWGNAHWMSGEACSEACCVKVLRSLADLMEQLGERAASERLGVEETKG